MYNLKVGIVRRFVRVGIAALIAGGIPNVVYELQQPEVYAMGSELLGSMSIAVVAGVVAALDKAVRGTYGSWLEFGRRLLYITRT